MAVMEQTVNKIKNSAFYDGEQQWDPFLTAENIVDHDRFLTYCPQKQVAIIRAAAGIPSYLNQYPVRLEFLTANRCIRSAWTRWHAAYLAANVDAPDRAQVDIPIFLVHHENMKPYLVNQITTLISDYNDKVNGKAGGAPLVDLSFYILMDNNQVLNARGEPLNTPAAVYTRQQPAVSKQDLTNQVLNQIPDVMLAHLGVYYQKALGAAESPPLAASLDLARMLSLADTLLAVAMPQTPAVAVDPPA
ncbi:uncharacterized protein B0H18DRAFT_1129837 [Fomitopsis serialis]|uniref:uncharacterized protein n=1 Tax=Fomitopsis serialis TaxID=139415 RepID=UPI0020086A9C|nr:uncharacterized protein B0H18DRAFT_1129837 [Neoantrodia serialis]KAH9910584.1 hypothetical protein B0H18DRAFT_1129837 [Neoantrodia serialis]